MSEWPRWSSFFSFAVRYRIVVYFSMNDSATTHQDSEHIVHIVKDDDNDDDGMMMMMMTVMMVIDDDDEE